MTVFSSPFGGSQNFVVSVDYCFNVEPNNTNCKNETEVNLMLNDIGVTGMVFNSYFSPDLYYSSGQKVQGFDQTLTTRLRPGYSIE